MSRKCAPERPPQHLPGNIAELEIVAKPAVEHRNRTGAGMALREFALDHEVGGQLIDRAAGLFGRNEVGALDGGRGRRTQNDAVAAVDDPGSPVDTASARLVGELRWLRP